MSTKFTIYIDESGESGITKVRGIGESGSSPYFVLGAVVCQPTAEVLASNAVQQFKDDIGKKSWKHATDLNHNQKVYFGRELGRLPVRYFALISNKDTLKEYKGKIDSDTQKFYNKCVKYLLEMVCAYLTPYIQSDDELSVVLERRNHDYDAMLRYIQAVKRNPIYAESKSLKILNPFSIKTRKKGESDLLEIADYVAHAVYQLTNKIPANFGIPEPRYFKEISTRFAGDKDLRIVGAGLKCIHDLKSLKLDDDIVSIINDVKVKAPSSKRN